MKRYLHELNDANTASVVSGVLGIPITSLTAGRRQVAGRYVTVNQSQLEKQVGNITDLVQAIE